MTVLDLFRLDDKVVIVTGASSGLGVAFAHGFAEAAPTWCSGRAASRSSSRSPSPSAPSAAGCSRWPPTWRIPSQCQRLVDEAMATFGRVDVLVNNAGVGTSVPATRETPEQFRSVIDVNLNGCYWMAQCCGRVMQPGSSIINISSILGITTGGLPQAAYSASKAGLAA